ncbi:hypothetical protein V8C86DRAFT_2509166, partial [Haematococcus lacustris]
MRPLNTARGEPLPLAPHPPVPAAPTRVAPTLLAPSLVTPGHSTQNHMSHHVQHPVSHQSWAAGTGQAGFQGSVVSVGQAGAGAGPTPPPGSGGGRGYHLGGPRADHAAASPSHPHSRPGLGPPPSTPSPSGAATWSQQLPGAQHPQPPTSVFLQGGPAPGRGGMQGGPAAGTAAGPCPLCRVNRAAWISLACHHLGPCPSCCPYGVAQYRKCSTCGTPVGSLMRI